MMDWRKVDTTHCGVAAGADVVGDRWTLLILRDIFAGVSRFDDLQRHVGVSTAVLADRLKRLCAHGVLERSSYREEGQRERFEYHLTAMGLGLLHVELAVAEFGYDHLVDPEHRLVEFQDVDTGQRVRLGLVRDDGTVIGADKLTIRLGATPDRT